MEKFKVILKNGRIEDPSRFAVFLSYRFGVGLIMDVQQTQIKQFRVLRADEKKMEEIKEWFKEKGIGLKYEKI